MNYVIAIFEINTGCFCNYITFNLFSPGKGNEGNICFYPLLISIW